MLNPFGDYGSITGEQMSYLTTGSLKDLYKAKMEFFALNFNGDMFDMGGGTAGWAAGYEHRNEKGKFSPDEFIAGGLTTGGASDPLEGGFSVDELFGEVYLPVTESLSFEASLRYSDYDTSAGDTVTYKLGGDWEIINGLRARATFSTGFRAPNIAELNQSAQTGFPIVSNPCEFGDRQLASGDISQSVWDNCQNLGFDTSDAGEYGFAWQSLYEESAPGDLDPEESETFTIGLVYTPDYVEGLSLSVDYWDIEIENVIGSPRFNVLFNDCIARPNGGSCQPFEDSGTGVNTGGFPGDAVTSSGNLGTLSTDGIDFAITYDHQLGGGVLQGFRLGWDAVYTNSYEEQYDLGGTIELVGTADGFGVFPEWKMNFQAGVYGENWNADWIVRYIDETEDLYRSPVATADAVAEDVTYHDLVGSYNWNAIKFSIVVNNITDEKPPYFHSAFNANTEPGMYDVIGRRAFASLTLEF